MPTYYAFEVVHKISGYLNRLMYPHQWAPNPEHKGASRIVVRECPDALIALELETTHEHALQSESPSEIWQLHCPKNFKDNTRGGCDVILLGIATQKMMNLFNDTEETTQINWLVPGRHNH